MTCPVRAGSKVVRTWKGDQMRLNTFLNFGGNCEQAFRFYEEHLGGKIVMLMRRGPDTPAGHLARVGTVHPVRHHEHRRDGTHGI